MNWQPKETAPKDGTPFLAYLKNQYPKDPTNSSCWILQYGVVYDEFHEAGGEQYWRPEFTHWAPLPDGPK